MERQSAMEELGGLIRRGFDSIHERLDALEDTMDTLNDRVEQLLYIAAHRTGYVRKVIQIDGSEHLDGRSHEGSQVL